MGLNNEVRDVIGWWIAVGAKPVRDTVLGECFVEVGSDTAEANFVGFACGKIYVLSRWIGHVSIMIV